MADWSASAKQRIRRGIRAVESGRFESASDQLDRPDVPLQFFRARSKETYSVGDIGTFYLLLCEGNKGAETQSTEEVTAYLRDGMTFQGSDYLIAETLMADDAILEVVNTERSVRCTADGAILQNTTGSFSVFRRSGATSYADTSKDITALNDLDVDIASGAVCQAHAERDGTTIRWRITNADYTCPE